MSDFTLRVPWLTRHKPFLSLHIAPFPAYQIRNGRTRKVYHVGVIWGRQFMPVESGGSFWFDVPMRWRNP